LKPTLQDSRFDVAGENANALENTKAEKRILSHKWIHEEFFLVVDAGEPRPLKKLSAENVIPYLVDFVPFGKKAMSPDIE
jgi:hypothetical protein